MLKAPIPLKIFIAAGEASGDHFGAELMTHLKKRFPSATFIGVGGQEMLKAGLSHSLIPMTDLSIIGVSEVIPALFKIFRHWRTLTHIILKEQPHILITIDAPDFYLRLLKRIKKKAPHIPNIHYNAPALWASRPKRAKKMAHYVDHILCLFPMDKGCLEPYGIKSTFIGHPLTCAHVSPLIPLEIPKDSTPLTLLFGSRTQEVKTLIKPFMDACILLQKDIPNLFLLVPTFEHFKDFLRPLLESSKIPYIFVDPLEKESAYALSKAALTASGTVTLELAKAQLPFVVGYKVSALTYHIAKRVITTPFVCLVNILAGQKIVEECLQHECTSGVLSESLKKLLHQSSVERETLQNNLQQVYNMLQLNNPVHTSMTLACAYIAKTIAESPSR